MFSVKSYEFFPIFPDIITVFNCDFITSLDKVQVQVCGQEPVIHREHEGWDCIPRKFFETAPFNLPLNASLRNLAVCD